MTCRKPQAETQLSSNINRAGLLLVRNSGPGPAMPKIFHGRHLKPLRGLWKLWPLVRGTSKAAPGGET